MQTMMRMVILAFCLNGAAAMVTEAFGMHTGFNFTCDGDILYGFDNACEVTKFQEAAQASVNEGDAIQTALTIFGNFVKGLELFVNLITFQYILGVMHFFPFPATFVTTLQAIGGVIMLGTIIYIISGRGTTLGP